CPTRQLPVLPIPPRPWRSARRSIATASIPGRARRLPAFPRDRGFGRWLPGGWETPGPRSRRSGTRRPPARRRRAQAPPGSAGPGRVWGFRVLLGAFVALPAGKAFVGGLHQLLALPRHFALEGLHFHWAADHQRRALVDALRADVEDRAAAVAGLAAGLLG